MLIKQRQVISAVNSKEALFVCLACHESFECDIVGDSIGFLFPHSDPLGFPPLEPQLRSKLSPSFSFYILFK